MHELDSAASIDDIQNVIEDNSSFIDFRLLEHMINLAGTEENKEDLKNIGIILSAMQSVEFMNALQTLGLLSHLIMKCLS